MSGLKDIEKIVESYNEENKTNIFGSLISHEAFSKNQAGIFSIFILRMLEIGNKNAIADFFCYLTAQGIEDINISIETYLILWIRICDSSTINDIVTVIEAAHSNLEKIENLSKTPFLRLIEKIESYPADQGILTPEEPVKSKEFVENAREYSRTRSMSHLAGRVYLAIASIFKPYSFLPKKGHTVADSDTPAFLSGKAVAIKKFAGYRVEPLQKNEIGKYLESQQIDKNYKILKRSPPTPSTCTESVDNGRASLDLCLILAIQGMIHSKDEDTFLPFLQKFAAPCGIDSKILVKIIREIEHNREESTFGYAKEMREGKISGNAEWSELEKTQIFPDFDLPADDPLIVEAVPAPSPERVLEEISQFAGEDKSEWFSGDESKQWRAARMCVTYFIDNLNPDGFEFV